MSIGSGIFLIAVGAILAYAVEFEVGWIDLTLVGYILMAAGALILILGLVLLARKRRTVSETRIAAAPGQGERSSIHTTESDDPVR